MIDWIEGSDLPTTKFEFVKNEALSTTCPSMRLRESDVRDAWEIYSVTEFGIGDVCCLQVNVRVLTYTSSRSSKKNHASINGVKVDLIGLPEDDEQTPLIHSKPQPRPPHFRAVSLTALPNVQKLHNGFTIVSLLCAIVVFSASSSPFTQIPHTRLIEDAFCRQHYQYAGSEPIDEEMYKEPKIQGQVAFTFGLLSMIDSIVGIVAALPWGIAADRYVALLLLNGFLLTRNRIGRKPVFALALLRMSLGFVWWLVVLSSHPFIPIWAGWLSSLTLLIDGGNSILTAVLLSIVTDVAPEGSRSVFATSV